MAKDDVPKFEETDPVFDETEPAYEDTQPHQGLGSALYNKAADMGKSAVNSVGGALKSGVEGLADTGHGLVQGLTLGGSDEAIAAAKASSDAKPGSPDWVKAYRKYQALEQDKNKAAQTRSPYLYGAGQVAGMIAPAVLTAGATLPEDAAILGAKGAAKLTAGQVAKYAGKQALVGAGTGAVASGLQSEEGHLIGATPEEQSKLGADILGGAATGAVFGGALGAGAKVIPQAVGAAKSKVSNTISNYISESPFWRQAQKAKELGEDGINIYKTSDINGPIGETTGLIHGDTNATRDLVDRIYNVDGKLGQNVGDAINNATEQGVTVDLTDPMLQSVNKFKDLLNNNQTLLANPKAQKLYDTIFQMGDFDAGNLTPKEVQSLRNDVLDFAQSVKQTSPDVASLGYQFQGQINDLLKDAVPEYKTAAERFEQFRRLVPETIISGTTPVDISGIKLGNLKNDEAKLFSATKGMIQGSETPGTSNSGAKETLKNFLNGINEFDTAEQARIKAGLVDVNDLPKMINSNDQSQAAAMQKLVQDRSDQSALLKQAWRVNPQENASSSIKGATFGRGSVMNMANKYGLYKDSLTKPMKAPVDLVKNLYGASEAQLNDIGQKMSNIPGIASVGQALVKGLKDKDSMGVNAAIFSIMQNPQARILINAQDLKNKKDNGEE